jgi:hypothetical protein
MVGPYDRVYHRNMLVDDSIISLFFWQLLGREVAPVAPIGQGSTLYDLRQGAAFALTGQTLRDTLDSSTIDMLTTYIGQGNQRLRGYMPVSGWGGREQFFFCMHVLPDFGSPCHSLSGNVIESFGR